MYMYTPCTQATMWLGPEGGWDLGGGGKVGGEMGEHQKKKI